jgi:hypothetical protein
MSRKKLRSTWTTVDGIGVRLTQAQRQDVAEVAAELASWLKLVEQRRHTVWFTLEEIGSFQKQAAATVRHARTAMQRNALQRVADFAAQVHAWAEGIGSIPVIERLPARGCGRHSRVRRIPEGNDGPRTGTA